MANDEIKFVLEEDEAFEPTSEEELSKIVSYNIANTVQVLKLKIDDNEINLKPEFQRDFVWDISRASLFIDSLLIGLPIPSLFLGKSKEDESYIVIDGQQRLKSIYYFLQGKFNQNGLDKVFRLKNLKGRDWDNKTFDELSPIQKRRLNNAVLNSTIIEDIYLKPSIIHDIFHRLNTGGMPLKDQEIRNCIYPGLLNQLLFELNENNNWRALLNKPHADKRLDDIELILRFISLYYNLADYRPSMREFLSSYMNKNSKNTDVINAFKSIFDQTCHVIFNQIGVNAFRSHKYFNKSIYDSVIVAIAILLKDGVPLINLRRKHIELLKDTEYLKATSEATTTLTNVHTRINCALKYLK